MGSGAGSGSAGDACSGAGSGTPAAGTVQHRRFRLRFRWGSLLGGWLLETGSGTATAAGGSGSTGGDISAAGLSGGWFSSIEGSVRVRRSHFGCRVGWRLFHWAFRAVGSGRDGSSRSGLHLAERRWECFQRWHQRFRLRRALPPWAPAGTAPRSGLRLPGESASTDGAGGSSSGGNCAVGSRDGGSSG